MRPDRAGSLHSAPLNDLLLILLRQHKRLLAQRGVELTDADMQALAQQMAGAVPPEEPTGKLRTALADIVEESRRTLARWNLTFAQSLRTDMNAVPGWETTAEFLEIANEKGNAELRIASGVALLLALGDLRYADEMLAAVAHDPDEIETAAGRRILSQLSGVDSAAPDWESQVRAWRAQQL